MKKQFIHPWAEMYKVHHRLITATSLGDQVNPEVGDKNDFKEETGLGFAPTRTATFGSTPTVIYGDDYE